jgi:hypothetical protein
MKSFVRFAATSLICMGPSLSFAQSNGPVTRAQVLSELIAVEKAGFEPGMGNGPDFPGNLQAAEARVAAQNRLTEHPNANHLVGQPPAQQ